MATITPPDGTQIFRKDVGSNNAAPACIAAAGHSRLRTRVVSDGARQ